MTHRSPAPTSTPPALPAAAVAALRRTVAGAVVYPPDVGWGPLAGRHHPSAVVVAASEHDVVAGLRVADDHGLTWQVAHAPEPWTGDLLIALDALAAPPDGGPFRVLDRDGCVLEVDEVAPDHLLLAPAAAPPTPRPLTDRRPQRSPR